MGVMLRRRVLWAGLSVVVGLIYVFMLGPIAVVVVEAFNRGELMQFPPNGWSLRWFAVLAEKQDFLESFAISLEIAVVAAVVATLAGTAAAYAMTRLARPRQAGLETLLLAPLYVPRILVGMALLLGLSILGFTGSLPGMVAGHVLITLPLVIRSVGISLKAIDPAIEEASRVLGASWWESVFMVTLPLARTGILAGAVFAFITSFTDVYLALFISGPETITLPLRIFNFLEWEQSPIVAAAATAQVLVILAVVLAAEKFLGLSGRVSA